MIGSKRTHRVIALSLPEAPEQTGAVSRALADYARTQIRDFPLGLLDVGGAGAEHRRAIEAAVGAERCRYFDTSPILDYS